MQSFYESRFVRDMGCTPQEWLQWLPEAIGSHRWALGHHQADVNLPTGGLHLAWSVLPPRQIALLRMPRLQVTFEFRGLSPAERYEFMKRFDLYMQRGGG